MKRNTLLLALATLALGATSCKKDDAPVTSQNNEVKTITIDASKYDKYVYFSFEEGKVVETNDWNDATVHTKTNWDLGLHRYEFRTNSGESGAGQGGAFETASTNIQEALPIPAPADFVTDTRQRQLVSFSHGGGAMPVADYQETSLNLALSAQINYTPMAGMAGMYNQEVIKPGAITQYMSRAHGQGGSGPAVELSNKVYIVRTATGRFAKVKVTGYSIATTGDAAAGAQAVRGHITLQYVYPIQ